MFIAHCIVCTVWQSATNSNRDLHFQFFFYFDSLIVVLIVVVVSIVVIVVVAGIFFTTIVCSMFLAFFFLFRFFFILIFVICHIAVIVVCLLDSVGFLAIGCPCRLCGEHRQHFECKPNWLFAMESPCCRVYRITQCCRFGVWQLITYCGGCGDVISELRSRGLAYHRNGIAVEMVVAGLALKSSWGFHCFVGMAHFSQPLLPFALQPPC